MQWQAASGPAEEAIHWAVWRWAEQTPFSVAVSDRGRDFTYRELATRAETLARTLGQRGVGPEVLVGISAERSVAFVIAVLGVLRAGGAYVPIDPSYPADRRDYLLADSQCSVLLTESGLASMYVEAAVPLVLLDEFVREPLSDSALDRLSLGLSPAAHSQERQDRALPPPGPADDSLAYVIYTSGSTGKPKGVCVTHHNLLRLFRKTEGWFHFQPTDVWTLFHSFSFDFSVWEMWGALLYGGRLVMVPLELSRDPLSFYQLVRRERVTVLNQTPPEFRLFQRADALAEDSPSGPAVPAPPLALRYVMLGGEALDLRTLAPWFGRHGDSRPRIFNLYGITETSVIITYRPLASRDVEETRSLIGVPIPDLELYVLDEAQRPVALGGEGELWVRGAGVARGYLRRPELTAERFRSLPLPSAAGDSLAARGGRLYRSGDLVRQHPDGELEYLGRIDQQVKIGGHRIELGEIAAALRAQTGVADAAVTVRRDHHAAALAAYVVAHEGQVLDLDQIKAKLRTQLPEYMCPASLQEVPRIPLTGNGKIDQGALPAPPSVPATTRTPPSPADFSQSERELAALFAAALGREVESPDADFFAQGGGSLQAMQLSLQVAEQLGVTLPPGAIFQQSSVRRLAATIAALRDTVSPPPTDPPPESPSDWQPLSSIQEQMWFVQSLSPDSTAFHCPAAFLLRGDLDEDRLRSALRALQSRHPLLRARFALRQGQPRQQIADAPTFDLQRVPDAPSSAPTHEILAGLARRPFDLQQSAAAAWLLRTALQEHVFLLVLHHLITDGWSLEQLLRELSAEYRQLPVTPPRYSYFDYVSGVRQRAQSAALATAESYFLRDLAGAPPSSELPTEWPRPRTPTLRGALLPFTLPPMVRRRMQPLLQAEGCTASVFLFSALFALLHRYSGQRDLLIGMPYAGRDIPGSGALQGPLLNLLPIRITLPDSAGQATFRSLVRSVRGKTQAAYAHSQLPFARLREQLGGARDSSRHPLFQLAFAPQPGQRAGLELPGLQVQSVLVDPGKSPYDLTLYAWPDSDGGMRGDSGIYCEVEYASDLYSRATIERLIDHFGRLLLAGCDRPDTPLGELPLLSDAERRQIIESWSGQPARRVEEEAPLRLPIELFAERVQAQPHAEAIRCGSQVLSYAQLDRASDRIAQALLARGIGRESLVALACPRGPAAIAGILGVWKAGAAYVPLDPSYPQARLDFMLQDSRATLVLSVPESAELAGRDRPQLDLTTLMADEGGGNPDIPVPLPGGASDALAYVIYTSGSTGQPKGVLIEQRSLATLARAIPDAFPLPAGGRLLQFASLSFDWSVAEVLIALTQGGTLVIPAQRTPLAGPELAEFLAREQIHQVLLPPSVLAQLPDRPLPALQLLLVGGERCPAHLVERFARNRRFRNAYGPTEATIVATVYECQPQTSTNMVGESRAADPAIGRPLPGAVVYVLDASGRLVPPLVTGELHIGGGGLARGYHARPELTAERFPRAVTDVDQRLYRTGDLARFRTDGTLEFLGRRDDQRKLRGFRIELGEIEAALRHQAGVQSAAALVDGEGAEARLLAYVVRDAAQLENPASVPDPEFLGELRRALRAELPPQLVPAELIVLPKLPLTENGKLDQAALPRHAQDVADGMATQNAWESLVAEIWSAVLGRPVPRTANFFDVGGSSLRLIEVQARLEAKLGTRIPLSELFANPTIEAMGTLIARGRPATPDSAPSAVAPAVSRDLASGRGARPQSDVSQSIAIIGMSGRFPKAPDIATFWRNLRDGVDSITQLTAEELLLSGVPPAVVKNPSYVRARGLIADEDGFDATLFGMGAHEAERTDPQHRIWLECALSALEDAGCNPQRYPGLIGVFAGVGSPDYLLRWPSAGGDPLTSYQLIIGNDKDFVATRTAYKLGLRGPCMSVQTACSSSLVAVALACQQLLSFQCDMAIAGGASLGVPTRVGYWYRDGMILSPDGRCRAFDARAQGTVPADGAGAVVLKRLEEAQADGDDIYAVIRGVALNNDGENKVGFTAPSVPGQVDVITRALVAAGLTPRDITLIEAHGTGTALGDPIEFAALDQVFRAGGAPAGHCALGSAKTYVGHMNCAAGIAGLIKAVLSIRNRALPALLHFEKPNPEIKLADSPFYINTQLKSWTRSGPLAAGVSSFGIGGTNAHVIVSEAPPRQSPPPRARAVVIPISAASQPVVRRIGSDLAAYLEQQPQSLVDLAQTLQIGRIERRHRHMVVARSAADAIRKLRDQISPQLKPDVAPAVGFLFPGQGSQYPGMALGLAQDIPFFAEELGRADRILNSELGIPLLRSLEDRRPLDQTALLQPILFAVEYAIARLLMHWGLRPAGLLGHSLGEYVAACLADVFSLEQALSLVAERGRLMADTPAGAMLSVPLSEAESRALLPPGLDLAAVNGPSQCVVSGEVEAIEALMLKLASRGLEGRRLRTSNAFHSRLMEPILDRFARAVSRTRLRPGTLPFLSCLTGDYLPPSQATQPDYWVMQLRSPVRFDQALGKLLARAALLVEAGPGETLAALARRHSERPPTLCVLPTLGRAAAAEVETERTLSVVGTAWSHGIPVDWSALRAEDPLLRLHLPTYPFERKKFWGVRGLTALYPQALTGTAARMTHQLPLRGTVSGTRSGRRTHLTMPGQAILDPKNSLHGPPVVDPVVARPQGPAGWLYAPVWRPAPALAGLPGSKEGKLPRRLLLFAQPSPLGQALLSRLGDRTVVVQAGPTFIKLSPSHYEIRPDSSADMTALLQDLRGDPPDSILHAFALSAPGSADGVDAALAAGYFSVIALVHGLTTAGLLGVPLNVLTVGAVAARGRPSQPLSAMLCGLGKVLPMEYPELPFRQIDLAPQEVATADVTALLLSEIAAPNHTPLVAFRAGERLHPVYEPLGEVEPPPLPMLQLGGVYLITGGMGGIGLTLAEHLAVNYNARLILAGRNPPPPESDWPHILAQPKSDEARLRLEKYLRIRSSAGGVLVQTADVGDATQARALVDLALQRYGTLDGVIHTAGVAEGGMLHSRSRESSLAILRAKVAGTLALESALASVPIDFFLLCSSLTAILGGLGQADYAAANSFLDAFAASRDGADGRLVISVNWDGWREIGAAARYATQKKESHRTTLHPHPLLHGWELTGRGGAYCSRLTRDSWLFSGVSGDHPSTVDRSLPAVTFLELSCALATTRGMALPLLIRHLQLLQPLFIPDGDGMTLHAFVQEDRGELSLLFESQQRDGSWKQHALAQVSAATVADQAAATRLLTASSPSPDAPQSGDASLLPLPVLGGLRLPEAVSAEGNQYILHPALLEIASRLLLGPDEPDYAADAFAGVCVLSHLGSSCEAKGRLTRGQDSHHGPLQLFSPTGELLVSITEAQYVRMEHQPAQSHSPGSGPNHSAERG